MTALRRYSKVENHTLNIQMPDDFNGKDVEVIIIPKVDEDDLSFLNKEIAKGMNSPMSEESHKEIFSKFKEKYAY